MVEVTVNYPLDDFVSIKIRAIIPISSYSREDERTSIS